MDFYQFFSFSAKKAIHRASEVCQRFCNQFLEPEHVFYSVLQLTSCSAVQVLYQLGVNLPKLTSSLEDYLLKHSEDYRGQPSFSKRTIEMLDASMNEVKHMHHREIGTTHLLIAILQSDTTFMQAVRRTHKLNPKQVRGFFAVQLRQDSDQVTYSPSHRKRAPLPDVDPNAEQASYLKVMSAGAARALKRAKNLAELLRHQEVTPEHVAYCLLIDDRATISTGWLERADRKKLIVELLECLDLVGTCDQISNPHLNNATVRLLSMSFELMVKLGRPEISSAHLLVSLLQIPGLEVRRVFDKHNLTDRILEDARQVIGEVTGEGQTRESPEPPAAGNDIDNDTEADSAGSENAADGD